MSLFPKVQSPCPYKGKFADIMQGNQCRLCKREVVDLTALSSEDRMAFLNACETEVCVSYRVGARTVLAAMAMSTVTIPSIAEAQVSSDPQSNQQSNTDAHLGDASNNASDSASDSVQAVQSEENAETFFIIVGGMRKPSQAEWLLDAQIGEVKTVAVGQEGSQMQTTTGDEKPPLAVEYEKSDEIDVRAPVKPETSAS